MSKPQMKPTFVIGLGHIPNDWSINSVNSLCTLKGRIGWRGYTKEDLTDNGPLVIGATQINSSNSLDFSKPVYISKEKFDESPEIQVSKGDIILVKTGNTIGKVAYIDQDIGEATINPNTALLKDIKCNPKFLFYVLSSSFIKKRLLNLVTVGAQPSINQASLKAINIGMPNPKEQQKIASILSSVDEAIEKTERIIEQSLVVKEGVSHQLLTKGIGHSDFYESQFGSIPKSWKILSIEQIVLSEKGSIKIGPFGSQLKKTFLVENGHKVYGQENVYKNDFNLGDRFIDQERFLKLESCEINPNDFLITMMGTIGKCAIVPQDIQKGIMDSHLLRLRLNPEIYYDKLLLHSFKSTLVQRQVSRLSVGGIMAGLSSSIIKQIMLPIPPIKEQKEIEEVLSGIDEKIKNEYEKKERLKHIKKGLMQQLLTGKVRVPLNENEEVPQ